MREVNALSPEEFAVWLQIRHIRHIARHTTLIHAALLIDDSEPEGKQQALAELLTKADGSAAFLKSSKSGHTTTPAYAFSSAAGGIDGLFDDLAANGSEKRIRVQANYADDDHFVVDTTEGLVRLRAIVFDGERQLESIEE